MKRDLRGLVSSSFSQQTSNTTTTMPGRPPRNWKCDITIEWNARDERVEVEMSDVMENQQGETDSMSAMLHLMAGL